MSDGKGATTVDELRRGDTARGIQSGTMRLRGGAYRDLRVTAKAAQFTARTSQRAMRTAGSAAMNRIKRALLAGDKDEIRKFMTDEEIRRWDSLTTFQKRKIIKEAGNYADRMAVRGAEGEDSPQILAGKMNKMTRRKLPYRYEMEAGPGGKMPVIHRTMWEKDAAKASVRTGNGRVSAEGTAGYPKEGRIRGGIVPDTGPDIRKNGERVQADPAGYYPEKPFIGAVPGERKGTATLDASPQGMMKAGRKNGSLKVRSTGGSARNDAIQGTVFYAKNIKAGDRKAAKITKKYKKAVARENRQRAAAFLGSVLNSVNKDSERSSRIEAQYRAQAISIDRYAEERRMNTISRALLPAGLAGKAAIRKAGRKIAEAVMKLIPPFIKQLFAWLLAGIALLLLFLMILSVLFAGGSQERQADLGLWRLTGYCKCDECCGKWAGKETASGVWPVEGRTVAIHATTMEAYGLCFGDKLMIRDHLYTLEDHGGSEMGGSNGGKCVDIYVEEHADTYRDEINGYANVYLVSEDGSLSLIGEGSGSDIVAYADQFVGCPYVWGGSSLTEGCDCSHFVWLVLMNCGVYSGEYLTSGEWAYAGTPVGSLADARAGDIVVYSGHVAIYDGAGMIVEAKGSAWGITHDRNVTCKPIVAIRRFT